MILGLFIWLVVIILSGAFIFSYLVWSPRQKSPNVIALELMEISTQIAFVIGALSVFLGTLFVLLWLFDLLK